MGKVHNNKIIPKVKLWFIYKGGEGGEGRGGKVEKFVSEDIDTTKKMLYFMH